ncbi:hypothetical protein HYX01_04010 [Candidatus Woesearchaeota archaeon]|nr:hypothetical protein [Candidatus Woesearchaeota archaeon]
MGLASSIIETGVDKLVNLVNEKGKISSYDAASSLGVSNDVIMEWADFLEEEGIISIEYKLTKPFLIARKLGKKDLQEKSKEFSGKKDVFVRKAEVSLSFLDKESKRLEAIKGEFNKIKNEIGIDIGSIKRELEELQRYERLKIDLDKQIGSQKALSLDRLQAITKQIIREKKSYEEVLGKLKKEEEELGREKVDAKSLEETEKLIKEKLESLKALISSVENRAKIEEEHAKASESRMERLSAIAKTLKIAVEKEKSLIEPLVNKSKEQTDKMRQLQKRIIEKIKSKENKFSNVKKASAKLKELFEKKMDVMNLIEKLNSDRNELQNELIGLIKKARSFDLASKDANVEEQILGIEKKFEEVDKKKKAFEEEFKKLSDFVK